MNPNNTWLRRDAQDEKDERFVARYLEKQGMKAVKRDAVVLDLNAMPFETGPFTRGQFPTWLRMEARRAEELRGAEFPRASLLRSIADQIEAQTRPPKPPEPQGLGAVVEDTHGEHYVQIEPDAGPVWRCVRTANTFTWGDIPVVRVLSDGWEPKP